MTIPSAMDWVFMRRAVTDYMPDTVSFYTHTRSYDINGQATRTSTLAFTIQGQLNSPTGRDRELLTNLKSGGVQFDESIRLTVPYGTPVTTQMTARTANDVEWKVIYIDTTFTFTAATQILLVRSLVNGQPIEEGG